LIKIQSAGLQGLFTDWVNTGLTHLNLHRCSLLENEALDAVITHSGHSLIELDLNSVDELEEHVLKRLASECKEVQIIDLSFIRSCDDFVLGLMMKEMKELKTVFVHGNNRVTDSFPGRVS
jgi:DNA repair protein RAD7